MYGVPITYQVETWTICTWNPQGRSHKQKNIVMFKCRNRRCELCGIIPALWDKVHMKIPHLLGLLKRWRKMTYIEPGIDDFFTPLIIPTASPTPMPVIAFWWLQCPQIGLNIRNPQRLITGLSTLGASKGTAIVIWSSPGLKALIQGCKAKFNYWTHTIDENHGQTTKAQPYTTTYK